MKELKINDKSTYIRQLLDKSLNDEIITLLCKFVGEKRLSAWKAAEIAGVSLHKMLDQIKKHNTPGYSEDNLNEDLKFALEQL